MIKVDSKLRNKNIVKNGGRLYVTKSNSEEFMDEVVGMYNDGAPVTEIADRLGVAKATVYRIIKERS